jgi:hypothetical protein
MGCIVGRYIAYFPGLALIAVQQLEWLLDELDGVVLGSGVQPGGNVFTASAPQDRPSLP